jgi:hypothetical protein
MKTCLLFASLFISFSLTAQSVDVSNGLRLPNKTNKFKIVGKNNDGIILRLYGLEDVIDVFDESFRLVTTRTLDFKNESGLLQYIMLNKSGAVIFYLSQDKKFSVLLAQPVNSKFIEIGKPIVIDTIFDKRDMVAANLRFKPSVDQSYLMAYYPFFNGTTIQSFKFICLDRSLHLLYDKTVPANRPEKELEESKPLVDNNGNSFLILHPESAAAASTVFDVLHISSTGDYSTYNVVTQKALFAEPMFDFDNKNGNLVMSGFYNDNKEVEDVANGFIYSSFDPVSGKVISATYTQFSKDFIAELTNRPNNDKAKLYTFSIRKDVLRNDGGLLIVAESFIKDSKEVPISLGFQPGFNNYRTSTVYQFNDIITFSIDAKANLDWFSIMRKKQASEDDNGLYSSFLMMNEKDKLRLIYLDDVSTSGILNEYVLTSDGKNTRSAIINQEDKDLMLLPKLGRQISPNQVVIPSYMNGNLKLAKITF